MISLDSHAHVDPRIAPARLERLNACVVAVTRSSAEYRQVRNRRDRTTVWALGVHPGVSEAHAAFDACEFEDLLKEAAIVGEIGLDGGSSVPMETQLQTLTSILQALTRNPRPASLHSVRAASPLLDAISDRNPGSIILHWWRGTRSQTQRALELGCYFSINAAEIARPKIIDLIPADRILTETDHPFGDRQGPTPRQPGQVQAVEAMLAEHWGVGINDARRRIWVNFRRLVMETETGDRFPADFQAAMLAA